MQWLNEPPQWSESQHRLMVKTAPDTDFWRVTHYGFIRHTGHFYFDTIQSDFTVDVAIAGQYRDLYDQAGIMLRYDEHTWLKTGIEYVDGLQNLSVVVTRDYSDWSVIPLTVPLSVLRLRVVRRQEAVQIFYLDEQNQPVMIRMAYFPVVQPLQVGMMCASPQGQGFEVTFEDYQLQLLSE